MRIGIALVTAALLLAAPAGAQVVSTKPVENRGNAAPVGTPNLMLSTTGGGQTDLCVTTQALGYGTPAIGLTVDLAKTDHTCQRLRLSRRLQELGDTPAAAQILCAEPEVRAAREAVGSPCLGSR